MILKNLIEKLEQYPRDKVVPKGFNSPHSYREFYSELAFEPCDNTTVGEMLDCAKEALNNTYEGYKGGEYTMDEWTDCYLAVYSECGDAINETMLNYMLNDNLCEDGIMLISSIKEKLEEFGDIKEALHPKDFNTLTTIKLLLDEMILGN